MSAPVTTEAFRLGMRQLASGVAIISARGDDGPVGLTATSVSSLSAKPPSLLCCVNNTSPALPAMRRTGVFCINILRRHHETLAMRFAGATGVFGTDKYGEGDWSDSGNGVPWLDDALVRFRCSAARFIDVSTHAIILGEISGISLGEAGPPLIYGDGVFSTLASTKEENHHV